MEKDDNSSELGVRPDRIGAGSSETNKYDTSCKWEMGRGGDREIKNLLVKNAPTCLNPVHMPLKFKLTC